MRTRALDSLESIYARCDAVPDAKCMLWRGAMAKNRYPISQAPDDTRANGQRQVHVRRRVWELAKGKPAPKVGRYILEAKCGNDRCVAEDCLRVKSKSQKLREVASTGVFSSLLFRAKTAEGRRRGSTLTDEGVAEIMAGTEDIGVLAERHGVTKGYAYAVRRGEHRRDYRTPFSPLVPCRT